MSEAVFNCDFDAGLRAFDGLRNSVLVPAALNLTNGDPKAKLFDPSTWSTKMITNGGTVQGAMAIPDVIGNTFNNITGENEPQGTSGYAIHQNSG